MTIAAVAGYRAFISYSHRDSAFAGRLHRRLETYRLPSRFGIRRRMSPIFKDREELPASGDLSTQVRGALSNSEALIVICSPHAAGSVWVNREIEIFRALHPDRPVLAALIEGEPQDAFPPSLSSDGSEPLAADFRPSADGDKLAFLKLIAGLNGIGVDQLVQRDAQRRVQRVTAVTAMALAATVVMAAMTVIAIGARAEADRQREAAEGLVDFMLTDLRDRLEGVGRLDVLTDVNRRALSYYARQDLARLPPDSLQRRAEVLQKMGDDDMRRGQLGAAMGEFSEARRVTGALLAADPENPKRIWAHAQSEYWTGYVDWKRGRHAPAAAAFRRYAALAERLLVIDPKNSEWRMEAGYAQSNLGTLALRDQADPLKARRFFETALQHFAMAARLKPADAGIQRDLADAHGWLADSLRDLGDIPGAFAQRRREAEVLRRLKAGDPKNVRYARDELGVDLALSQLETASGNFAAARVRLDAAYDNAARLATSDPANLVLAQQRTVIGLALVQATWSDASSPAAGVAKASTLLRGCAASALADVELLDFCMVLRAHRAAREGAPDSEAERYLSAHRPRLARTKRSARWGIDFAAETRQPQRPAN